MKHLSFASVITALTILSSCASHQVSTVSLSDQMKGNVVDKSYIVAEPVRLNDHTVKRLSNLGMLWGFLKYYHPSIAKGDYDWDAELLEILPGCFAANSDKDFYAIVNHLVDTLGTIPILDKQVTIPLNKIKI